MGIKTHKENSKNNSKLKYNIFRISKYSLKILIITNNILSKCNLKISIITSNILIQAKKIY